MNAEKVNEAWECNSCNQLHTDLYDAINCCPPNQIRDTYKCGECGDIYEQEEVAEELGGEVGEIRQSAEGEEKMRGVSIQRYKGLGEMNPDQLWSTTMDPTRRMVRRVMVADAQEADKIFSVLMGSDVLPRKRFIQAHAKNVKNLDV